MTSQIVFTLATATIIVKVLTWMAVIWSAGTVACVRVKIVRMIACWWVFTLALAFIVIKVFIIFTFFNVIAQTLAGGVVEILIVMAGLVLMAFTATALIVEVLAWMTLV